MTEETELIQAINHLEDVLAEYFAERDIPIEIREAVDSLEKQIERGWATLEKIAAKKLIEARAERDAALEVLQLISLSDGANAPAEMPTAEYLRTLAREALLSENE
jgi:hypothetical protein